MGNVRTIHWTPVARFSCGCITRRMKTSPVVSSSTRLVNVMCRSNPPPPLLRSQTPPGWITFRLTSSPQSSSRVARTLHSIADFELPAQSFSCIYSVSIPRDTDTDHIRQSVGEKHRYYGVLLIRQAYVLRNTSPTYRSWTKLSARSSKRCRITFLMIEPLSFSREYLSPSDPPVLKN